MRLILPVILAILGIVGGGAAGYALKPAPEQAAAEHGGAKGEAHAEDEHGEQDDAHGAASHDAKGAASGKKKKNLTGLRRQLTKATDSEYVAIEKKLIVPIERSNGRKAFVVLDATLEVAPGETVRAEMHEPKIVDAFLRVMIAFAATGAFEDHAETAMSLDDLNDALFTSAEAVLGQAVRGVLISNLITQDA